MTNTFIPWLRSSVGNQEEKPGIKKTPENSEVKSETEIEPKKSNALNRLKAKK